MVERRYSDLKIDIKRRWILNDRSKLAQWKSNCREKQLDVSSILTFANTIAG